MILSWTKQRVGTIVYSQSQHAARNSSTLEC